MPRVLIKESTFEQLQNNLAYTIIIRQHGFIIKQITDHESLDNVLIVKIEPTQVKNFQLVEKNKEYVLYTEVANDDNKTYSFAMTSLELPVSVLFDKIMKVIDPSYEEKSLLTDPSITAINPVEEPNEKPFLLAFDNFLRKTQSVVTRPFIQGIKFIQLGVLGVERSFKNGIETIRKSFAKSAMKEELTELIEKEVEFTEFLIQINKIYLNHVDSALLVNMARIDEVQNNLLLTDHSREDPEILKKKTIIFIHPFGLDLTIWKPYLNYFSNKDYRVIAYDMRGWGGSEQQKNDDYKFSDYYTDLKELLAEKNLLEGDQELILATASLSGLMLLNKLDSSLHKRNNIKLILLASSDYISKDLQDMVKKMPSSRTWGPLKKSVKNKMKDVILTKGIESDNLIQETIISRLLAADNKVTYETLKNLREKEYIEGLQDKQLDEFPFEKTLLILGEKDVFIPVDNITHLKNIQNVTIRVIENGNHFIAFERPELVLKEIDDWLTTS